VDRLANPYDFFEASKERKKLENVLAEEHFAAYTKWQDDWGIATRCGYY
jgi:hypothetical protein